MADCDNQIGVRNILITFRDCDNDQTYGPIAHELAGDEQPMYKMCSYSNEAMTGGYVKKTKGNNQIDVTVIRDLSVPLAIYQGCGSIDITIEHFNGMVVTGLSGTGTGDDNSDGHEVAISAIFKDLDELLPAA